MATNNNIVFRCTFHVVWCTKYRRKLLAMEVESRLKEIASEVAAETRCTIREMEGDLDHFHMLVDCDPQFGIHRFVKAVKAVKGRSSRLLRKEFSQLRTRVPTLWTNSYFVATVGGAPLAAIKKYIENQKCN